MTDAYPDIFDDTDGSGTATRTAAGASACLALPGPPLTHEQLLQALREGDESGTYEGNPFEDIRAMRSAKRLDNAAA